MDMTNLEHLELLSENIVNSNVGTFIKYNGFFKHNKIDGDTWKIKISVDTHYNSEDIEVQMFMQGQGWVHLAKFNDIAGMKSIPYHIQGNEVEAVLIENIKLIEGWLDTFH
jgi:hypothetical protein